MIDAAYPSLATILRYGCRSNRATSRGTDLRRLSGLKERLGQPGELIEIHGPNHPHLVMMSSGEDSPAERERSSGSLALGERQQLGEDGTFCHIGS